MFHLPDLKTMEAMQSIAGQTHKEEMLVNCKAMVYLCFLMIMSRQQ